MLRTRSTISPQSRIGLQPSAQARSIHAWTRMLMAVLAYGRDDVVGTFSTCADDTVALAGSDASPLLELTSTAAGLRPNAAGWLVHARDSYSRPLSTHLIHT